MPIIIKIHSSFVFNQNLREQLSYFGIDNRRQLSRDCWFKIGLSTPGEIIERNETPSEDFKDWINLTGFSRIDGYPIFRIHDETIPPDQSILDYLRKKGISSIHQSGFSNSIHYDPYLSIDEIHMLQDNILSGFGSTALSGFGLKKPGKQIFSDIDPYGEENWED